MRGLMMDEPLLISSLLDYAAAYHGGTEMVSATVADPAHRTTYAELSKRAKQLANALTSKLGVQPGDRLGTLAWNDQRHFEIYYGVSGIGAVCHTINPRLFPEQISFIINHAEDRFLFVDPMFVPLIEKLAPGLTSVEKVFVLGGPEQISASEGIPHDSYETLIADQPAELAWPRLDEDSAASLCYTSGTTGNPKGTLYSQRSTVLHALAIVLPDCMELGPRDAVLPVVPMFHVNAWGLPYACPLVGAKMVMPGPKLDGASLYEQLEREQVTFTAGVPTIWFGLLKHLRESGNRLTSLKRLVIGGSAAPPSMIDEFEDDHGIEVLHGWGMTEMSPVGAVGSITPSVAGRPAPEIRKLKQKQGHALWGVDLKIVDDQGARLPHDGTAAGLLMVRGPWITSGYYRDEAANDGAFDAEGWFATGDVATIDPMGYMQITDRAKDMVKSGGEWISSIDLENAAVGHPGIAEAAVIAIAHPRWDERPLLIAVRAPDATVEKADVLDYLRTRVAKWWLPDDVVFVDELPHTATGKLQKATLRERFKDHPLPG